MPKTYQSRNNDTKAERERLTAAELAQRNSLTILIDRYEAVRSIRCPERDEAARVLGIALARCEGPFRLNGLVWQWSWTQQSILRHKAVHGHEKQRS